MKYISLSLYVLVIISMAMLTTSCHKDPSTVAVFKKNDLPLSAGSWWRYRETDSVTHQVDTVTLRAAAPYYSSVGHVYPCSIERQGVTVDSARYTIMPDDSTIYFTGGTIFLTYKLIVPFRVGNYWPDASGPSEILVASYNSSYNVQGKTYDAFLFSYAIFSADANLISQFSLAKGVGLTDMTYTLQSQTGYHQKSLQLIDYHIQ